MAPSGSGKVILIVTLRYYCPSRLLEQLLRFGALIKVAKVSKFGGTFTLDIYTRACGAEPALYGAVPAFTLRRLSVG